MRISDLVAQYICDMLDSQNGNAEIKRNELATELGCVPSQINYVITSRFTPEQGYIVESRRGGGGYIRITRVSNDRNSAIIETVKRIGKTADEFGVARLVGSMTQRGFLTKEAARLILAATSERSYSQVPKEYRDSLRATLLKNMLLNTV